MRNKKLDGYVYASMLSPAIPKLQDEAPSDRYSFLLLHPSSFTYPI